MFPFNWIIKKLLTKFPTTLCREQIAHGWVEDEHNNEHRMCCHCGMVIRDDEHGQNAEVILWPEGHPARPAQDRYDKFSYKYDTFKQSIEKSACEGKISFPEATKALNDWWVAHVGDLMLIRPGESMPYPLPPTMDEEFNHKLNMISIESNVQFTVAPTQPAEPIVEKPPTIERSVRHIHL